VLESSPIVAFAAATDLHRARAFYEQVLGLPVTEQNDFACVLDANGTMLRITAVPEVCRAGYTPSWGWRLRLRSRSSPRSPAGYSRPPGVGDPDVVVACWGLRWIALMLESVAIKDRGGV
jgi:catechol 2,3-dioxygenase-like lactoylglutathione lyase family enzyme